MNYLIMAIFLGSVCYHVQQTTFAPKLQRDATSLLPMLTIWSCCMAYFFGFFGISFVDKDEDLLMEFEHTPWEPTNVEELPRTLGSIVEDTGAMTHTPSNTTPRALSTQEEEPVQDTLRNADDAERVAAVLSRSRTLQWTSWAQGLMGEKRSCRSPTTIILRASSAAAARLRRPADV